ncbi:cell wall / vacuolar inhibitor of fructosidase 2-like [Panicum miliaceum]|uniref:Cell wall / vacuolar inhibitor of fructosidase 2-like n=1 Tax=Panicum miliaceum TaxID=4540 RepID=A0A3L6PUK7_PANMI|nr:cell wall / vacuolar inhibitor of fructosidase 2-like [Panicum miliaceum]
MAPMSTMTNKAPVLLLLALLPLGTLGSRSGPSAHHGHAGHGPKHSSPPSSPTPASPAPAASPTAAALVRSTCNSTTYYDLCVSALGADPSSATADVRGLSSIAVSAAATNASGGAATAAALANGTAAASNAQAAPATADATVQALLRTCAAKYGQARDALSAARESIAAQDYDFANVHVSAAAEYPQVCKALFRRQRPGQYPAELAAREEALRQLCSVASDIIALLSNSTS